uniref:Uncharacterized protein n=1 Tax=Cacopsylla melanoneura TaxID=428564 RepID=A0A8D8RSC8_9HEMI
MCCIRSIYLKIYSVGGFVFVSYCGCRRALIVFSWLLILVIERILSMRSVSLIRSVLWSLIVPIAGVVTIVVVVMVGVFVLEIIGPVRLATVSVLVIIVILVICIVTSTILVIVATRIVVS